MLGGAFSAPTLMAMDSWESGKSVNTDVFRLSETQKSIVTEVAEMIIPRTATPGAKDANVPAFIEMMLQDCYRKPEHLSFVDGLQDLEKRGFLALNPIEKTALLKAVEAESVNQMKEYSLKQTKMNDDVKQIKEVLIGLPYWRLMKELTLLGYFTSEAGMKASFYYVPIPGRLEIVKLKPGQKSYAY
jgi:hypothetical protein